MQTTATRQHEGAPNRPAQPGQFTKQQTPIRRNLLPVALLLIAMTGLASLLYPSASQWFANLGYQSEVAVYQEQTEALPTGESALKLQAARDYNAQLPEVRLADPYLTVSSSTETSGYQSYLQTLTVGNSEAMGYLTYPQLDINLPIYHGTGEKAISSGIGHLYGSSLPVGGQSTHSVLTSHSGLLNSKLFTDLHRAQVGDTFQVSVLGQDHYYQVDQIETVLPNNTGTLGITPGADRVTLITCTPVGINSHRLLVHATAVPAPAEGPATIRLADDHQAGFPWWLVIFVAGSAAIAVALFRQPKTKHAKAGGRHTAAGVASCTQTSTQEQTL